MPAVRKKRSFRGIRALLLCAAAAFILVLPFSALAQNPEQKTVRVGWYDSSFCYWDEFGRRCGIDAEYQEKISAYTGWTYEYVEDSWSNLFQMLKDGEIDGYTTVYSFGSEQKIVPVSRVGASDYYYAVNKNRPDLLTGENMPLSFAVNRADRELYFILNKTAVMTDSADMDSALASYMHADQKVSFAQFLKEHWLSVVLSLLAVFTVIIVLLLQKLKAERTANLTARMIICMRTRTS